MISRSRLRHLAHRYIHAANGREHAADCDQHLRPTVLENPVHRPDSMVARQASLARELPSISRDAALGNELMSCRGTGF